VDEHGVAIEKTLQVRALGLVDYGNCLELQRSIHRRVVSGENPDTLLLCTHPPVITTGSSVKPEHILAEAELLSQLNLSPRAVERGGSVTYHGPEQIIAYPVLDLRKQRKDVSWYMRSLEEVVIGALRDFGVAGVRIPGRTGVWLDDNSKIAFIGVKISRWCTFHGFSLNVLNCSKPFSLIDPCGLGAIRVVSLQETLATVPAFEEIQDCIVDHFCKVFGYAERVVQ
jgi:lipoyl(octanoyl) transferase